MSDSPAIASAGDLVHRLGKPYAIAASARSFRESLHLVLNAPIGLLTFAIVILCICLGVGLVFLFPLALILLRLLDMTLRATGVVERRRIEVLLGCSVAAPPRSPRERSWKELLEDGQMWRTVVYALLLFPFGLITCLATLLAWFLPLTLLVVPFWRVGAYQGSIATEVLVRLLIGLLGIVLFAFIPHLLKALSAIHVAMSSPLLGPSRAAELEAEVRSLEASRSRIVESVERERRRIERDLHDGAQQRLVALAMSLGLARERLKKGDSNVAVLVDEAHGEAKRALAELRSLVRGIHPPLLRERGLGAALAPVAGLCSVPVVMDVKTHDRPSPRIESTVYFVVCEALVNVSKHSRATAATITIDRDGDQILLNVADDGIGGADSGGPGLAGLRSRVEAVGGSFRVSSPVGGPTVIAARLPWHEFPRERSRSQ